MTDQDGIHGLWADAVDEYEKHTERQIDKDSKFREFQTFEDFEKAIDNENRHFTSFRSEHRKLYSTMATCIKPLLPIIEIIQKGLGNTPYAPLCAIFGASSYLLRACALVSKAYDGIEELFRQVSDITARLKEYEYKSIETSLKVKVTNILAFILEIIGKAESCIKRRRIKQWARSVFLQEDDISASVTKLQKFVESELGLVIVLTYGRVKQLQSTTTDVQADVKLVKTAVDDVLANQRNDRQRVFSDADEKTLTDALKTASYDEIAREHASNVEKLTKGTGLWIKDDVMFQAWEQESAPILWVFGKPGVGKTMLAARMIETLQNQYPQHSDIPSLTSVSYIYFKDGNPDLRDCAQLWKAAALQIARANDRFKKHVLATIDKKQDTFASARRIWQQLFLDFFTENSPSQSLTSLAFIIVDGLDEGPEAERVKFLACLAELVSRTTTDRKCRIQVAVFARPDVRADPGFEKVGVRRQERIIEVTPERNTVDIEAFIRQRLGDVKILRILKKRKATKEYQALAKQIYTSVQSRSQGMFLWASLVFDQIWDSPSSEAVTQSLGDAPEGLDAMLHHIFKRLEVEEAMHRSYFIDLLSWIFCTYRPLYISELFVLLLITANQHCYMVEDDLKTRYSSLFNVTGPAADEYDSDEESADEQAKDEEIESEADDFDFLNNPDIANDEHQDEEEEHSDEDNDPKCDRGGDPVSSDQEAEEKAFNMPNRWHQTTVTFSHARIRDYLTTEGSPSTRRWHDCSIVPDNMNIRHLFIVLACIQILRTDIADKYSVESLKIYARNNWMKHLLEVDFTKIDKGLGTRMAQMLSTLFHHGRGLLESSFGVRNSFIRTWFCTNKYSSLVRKIITEYISDIDESQREWALLVKNSARALFQPLIAACARTWLTKKGWEDPAYLDKSQREVWIMYAFSTLDDEGNNDASIDSFNVSSGMWNIPLESIEAIANLEPLPKAEHWYAGVAWIMMEADEPPYTEQAIEYFNKALELKPGGWMAMEGLARCYGDNLYEYETAIDWMKTAINNLPHTEDLEGIDFYLETRISDWKLQLGQDEEAVESARAAYEGSQGFRYGTGSASDVSILRTIKHYIMALYRTEDYSTITKLLYELDSIATWEENRSLWIVFLREQYDSYYRINIFDKVGTIVRATKDDALAEFMEASIKEAVELNTDTISEAQPVWLATQAAEWQYHYAREPEESIDLYENIVTLIDQSNEVVQHSHAAYRTSAAGQLSSMYFNAAKSAYNEGTDYSTPVSKMENLAKHKQGSKRYYRASYPALVLGRWLREYAKADEETWKAAIKPSVKQALYLLSDDDPWNDQEAYCQLGQALLLADDILNASIALGITTKPIEDAKRTNTATEAGENASQDGFSGAELILSAAEIQENIDDDADEASQMATATGPTTEDTDVGSHENNDSTPPKTEEPYPGQSQSEDQDLASEEVIEGENQTPDADQQQEQGEINPKYAGFTPIWTCDGPCSTASDSYTELYFCCICLETCFYDECIQLIKSDKLPFRRCAADHEHVRVFPMTEDAKRITDALVERRFTVQQEWLDALKKEWQE